MTNSQRNQTYENGEKPHPYIVTLRNDSNHSLIELMLACGKDDIRNKVRTAFAGYQIIKIKSLNVHWVVTRRSLNVLVKRAYKSLPIESRNEQGAKV